MKAAVVGFGKLGLMHAGICSALKESKLACVIDQPNSMLDYFTSVQRIPSFHSVEEAINSSTPIDAYFVCTPTQTHAPIISQLLETGTSLFVEKPMVSDWRDIPQILKLAREKSIVTMVGYMSRHQDTFAKAHALLAQNAIGSVQMVEGRMYIAQLFKQGKGWRYSKAESGGGVLMTQNSHLIDMLLWLFGDIELVNGRAGLLYSKEVEDHFHGTLEFRSGALGFIDTSWSKRHHRTLSMEISAQGTNGTLSVNEDQLSLWLERPAAGLEAGTHTFNKPDLFTPVEFEIAGTHYTRQTREFMNAIATGSQCESNFESGARVQCVIEALYRSSANKGSPINVADVWREAL